MHAREITVCVANRAHGLSINVYMCVCAGQVNFLKAVNAREAGSRVRWHLGKLGKPALPDSVQLHKRHTSRKVFRRSKNRAAAPVLTSHLLLVL